MKLLKNYPYKQVLILGLAKSGTAAARLLLDSGVSVRVNDWNASHEDENVQGLKEAGAEVVLGSHPLSVLDGVEIVIKNPGIRYDNPIAAAASESGLPIITEVELAGLLHEGPMIAITGSNGKTTTTTLTYNMLAKSNRPARVAGNIGEVSCEVARETSEEDRLVIELSSFQLMGIDEFKPSVAVLLNIYEAHLDYHKTLENYQQAKANIFKNQTAEDHLVYNAENETIQAFLDQAEGKKVPFSTKRKVEHGGYLEDGSIFFQGEKIIDLDEVVLVGEHNLENILAAVSAAKLTGATNEGIREVLTTFSGVEHRLQFVKNLHDRFFYNDSKATNILATSKALEAFSQPVHLLAGGLDRGNEFDELIPFLENVKSLIVFGETAEKLTKAGHQAGISTIKQVDNVEQAARKAYELSDPMDVILLSPACASWDQYRTFEERGHKFVQAVHKLK
ncbi:UDP-N-acetylmuramoyl-L-alanine--D-glutamate ligase [Thalassobacillus pellis]|uniref:UDP-N-acetylmuramoyl-L-alanine--D-glutamate ligase n=1 Tax=Thalassobacillus pellis TaxID=748008 RepID=UPI0019612786|nr:UDP-N-acetylmuramoyl-L-alanine--D-glutamate ligase [Thalassobacillus pellis]MBM7552852.1 UDP-N-acetylmuramoylalanine--D-glutamate ligase [Thalassobacillus pellis]